MCNSALLMSHRARGRAFVYWQRRFIGVLKLATLLADCSPAFRHIHYCQLDRDNFIFPCFHIPPSPLLLPSKDPIHLIYLKLFFVGFKMSRKHGSSSTRSHSRPASSSRPLRENEVSRGGFLDFLLPNYYSDDEDSYYDDDDYTYSSMSYTCDDDTASAYSRRRDRRTRSDTMETLDTVNHRLEELDSTIDTSAVADAETVIDTIASGDDGNTYRDDSDDETNGGYENSWKMFLDGDESTPLFSRMVNHLLPNIEDLPQQTKQETTTTSVQKNEKRLSQTDDRDNTTMPPVQPNTPETRTETQERRSSSHDQDRSNIVAEENAVDANMKIEESNGNVKPTEEIKNTRTEATQATETKHHNEPTSANSTEDAVLPSSKVVESTQTAKPPSKGRFAKLRSPRASKKKALAAAAAAEEAARQVEAEMRRAERRERRRSQAVRITVTHE